MSWSLEYLVARQALAALNWQKAILRARYFQCADFKTLDRRRELQEEHGGWAPHEPYDALCDLRGAYLDAGNAEFPELPVELQSQDGMGGPWGMRSAEWPGRESRRCAPMSAERRLLAACALTGRAAPGGLCATVEEHETPGYHFAQAMAAMFAPERERTAAAITAAP